MTGSGGVRVLPAGSRALLVEVGDLAAVHRLHARVRSASPAGVVDLVPAATTLLAVLDRDVAEAGALAATLRRMAVEVGTAPPGGSPPRDAAAGDDHGDRRELVVVDVTYDGPDLDAVGAQLDLGRAEVVAWHTAHAWLVGFAGFAPGFFYLTRGPGVAGSDPSGRDVARRARPRPVVQAGAVAVAGPWSGIYPRSSPGGWQVLGTTTTRLWDADADPPARLAPGMRVRFRDVGDGS